MIAEYRGGTSFSLSSNFKSYQGLQPVSGINKKTSAVLDCTMRNGGNRHSCFFAFKLPIPHPAVPRNGVHGVHLFAHILRQRDLAAGADEVVLGILDLEVFIA